MAGDRCIDRSLTGSPHPPARAGQTLCRDLDRRWLGDPCDGWIFWASRSCCRGPGQALAIPLQGLAGVNPPVRGADRAGEGAPCRPGWLSSGPGRAQQDPLRAPNGGGQPPQSETSRQPCVVLRLGPLLGKQEARFSWAACGRALQAVVCCGHRMTWQKPWLQGHSRVSRVSRPLMG